MDRKYEPSDDEKQFWKAAAERRKEVAIRRGRWQVVMDENAIVSCHEIFTSWCAAFGKERATDYLVEALIEEHFLLIDRLKFAAQKKKVKWQKTSAKRFVDEQDT
jgi:hypothetical protein